MSAARWPTWSALAAALVGAAALTAFDDVAAQTPTRRETRAIPAFERIAIDAPAELLIAQGTVEALTVEAEPRVLPLLRTRVEQGTLHIDLAGAVQTQAPLRVHLTLRTLGRLRADNTADVQIGTLRTPALAIELDGSSRARVAELVADRFELQLAGSSELHVERGQVRQQQARIVGAASYEAIELRSTEAQLQLAGSGQARVHAAQRLDAVVGDSARLAYAGAPRVMQRVSGAAELLREPAQTP